MTRTLLTCLALAATTGCTALPMPHYRLQLDLYVRDPVALCKQAWELALAEMGPSTAELVTMTGGRFDTAKCLAAAYQIGSPASVVSAGVDVVAQ